jgi:hypothetical protein
LSAEKKSGLDRFPFTERIARFAPGVRSRSTLEIQPATRVACGAIQRVRGTQQKEPGTTGKHADLIRFSERIALSDY